MVDTPKTDLTFIKPLISAAIQDDRRVWTKQGFGFLRTYFGPADAPKKFRLNLWHSRFAVPNVSTIHDHPWDLTSLIVVGRLLNQRYRMEPLAVSVDEPNYTHSFTTIKTGVGGGLEKLSPNACILATYPPTVYRAGEGYKQHAEEIHETVFTNGTITLNERIGDTEHARVFWPYGTDWVDAIPTEASRDEVADTVLQSLREWF